MNIYRSQQFKDKFGMEYEVTTASKEYVLVNRIGNLPAHIMRSFVTTMENITRLVSFNRWEEIKNAP
jgi:hypothetical protein